MGSSITEVAGIGPSTATLLTEHGIKTAEALARSSQERLLSIPGFGPARAQSVLAAAVELVGASVVSDAKSKKKKDKKERKSEKRKAKKVKKSEEKDAKGKKSKGKRRKRNKRRKSKS